MRVIGSDELCSHASESSCWMSIEGTVYDLTDFLSKHPGGKPILVRNSGRDATLEFKKYHSSSILDQLPATAVVGRFVGVSNTVSETQLSLSPNIPLGHILNVYDFARNARARLTQEAWDYLVSAADDEVTYRENESSFNRVWIRPRVLTNVAGIIDTSVSLLGTRCSAPVFISSTAMGRLYHPDGEVELCRGASRSGIIQMCPTLASCSIAEMASARSSNQSQWYQLYVNTDMTLNEKVIKQAEALGYKALVITVDVAVLGKRERDQRNKVTDISNIQRSTGNEIDKSQGVSRALSSFVSAALDWDTVRWINSITKMPILLKGIQTKEDAVKAAESGLVRGIIVSNHGGRQVDFSRPSVACLVEIVDALRTYKEIKLNENFDVYVDGGIRRGTDIFKCLALGAKAVGIGRPAIFALASHGKEGVHHLIDILTQELIVCLMHTGCRSLKDISRTHVELTKWSSPRYDTASHESRL